MKSKLHTRNAGSILWIWVFIHFLLGEPLDEEEAEEILRECCDSVDEDGFITYESKFCYLTVVVWLKWQILEMNKKWKDALSQFLKNCMSFHVVTPIKNGVDNVDNF